MRTTDIQDLMDTVERLRAQHHPDLDSKFLLSVLQAEKDNPEDDVEAIRAIQAALDVLLASKGPA